SVPVVPKSLRESVLRIFHDSHEAGHFGVKKTKERIKNRVFWDGMNKDIHTYVKTCEMCQKSKTINQKPMGLLQEGSLATRIFQTLHMDFIGPLPPSKG